MAVSRRRFLERMMYGLGALMLPFPGRAAAAFPAFSSPFAVPPVDEGTRSGDTLRFDLTARRGSRTFLPPHATSTLGVNGDYLGPVLRARKGDTVEIRVNNRLGEPTTLHWHGFILPASMDGGPHQQIADGGDWTARFDIVQDAATLWYHSHQYHRTGPQVYQGLAGVFIVDDDASDRLGLPSTYGVDDFPVVIQDREFDSAGRLVYVNSMPERMHGKHGDTVLVNGVVRPRLEVSRGLIRLRLLNGSNARTYRLAWHDQRRFSVIAGDGGFLPAPVSVSELTLAPGERAEIVVDVSDRSPILLKGLTGAVRMSGMMGMMMSRMGFDREMDILVVDPAQAVAGDQRLPDRLPTRVEALRPDLAVAERSFTLDMRMGMMGGGTGGGNFTINGRSMDMSRVDFRARPNSHEIWRVVNDSPMPHPFHVHNTQFRVLARNGKRPGGHERGLKDTVLVNGQETVSLLVPMGPYADPDTPYMYHCHNLEHEDQGMMGQFVVA